MWIVLTRHVLHVVVDDIQCDIMNLHMSKVTCFLCLSPPYNEFGDQCDSVQRHRSKTARGGEEAPTPTNTTGFRYTRIGLRVKRMSK